jgi:hypothetical protein
LTLIAGFGRLRSGARERRFTEDTLLRSLEKREMSRTYCLLNFGGILLLLGRTSNAVGNALEKPEHGYESSCLHISPLKPFQVSRRKINTYANLCRFSAHSTRAKTVVS